MSEYHSYTPSEGHGLKYSPFKALIAPRPIGWISTVSAAGEVNLAPYSFFNALSEKPAIIGFCSDGRKDSLRNIEETGVFVHNVVSAPLVEKMNTTSGDYAHGQDEMDPAGLTAIPSETVKAPRVSEALASMECQLVEIKQLAGVDGTKSSVYLILGEVKRVHIDRRIIVDGLVDEQALAVVGRLGYFNYANADEIYALKRPKIT